ncbi:hypothetical protein Tco_0407473 [Tanacetum coccineum]
MFSVRRFDCFPLSKGDDTFWFGSKTVGMDESLWSEFGISSLRGSRVDGRSYLLSGAIDGSEANIIIHDSKLEFKNSRKRSGMIEELQMRVGSEMVTCCGKPSVLLKEGVPSRRKDIMEVIEGREDVREVFKNNVKRSQKRKLVSRCGKESNGEWTILAFRQEADDFVVYYDARSKDLEACLEKGEGDCLYVATTEGSYEGLHG